MRLDGSNFDYHLDVFGLEVIEKFLDKEGIGHLNRFLDEQAAIISNPQ